MWSEPLKKWELEFECDETTGKQLEAFFISKRGRFKSFEWTWSSSLYKGGDDQTYNVRFDTDELSVEVSYYGYRKIKKYL